MSLENLVELKNKIKDLPKIAGRAQLLRNTEDNIMFLTMYKSRGKLPTLFFREREKEYNSLILKIEADNH